MLMRYGRFAVLVAVVGVGTILGGCSTGDLLPTLSSATTEAPKMRATRSLAMVSLRPIVGAPPEFSQAVVRQLNVAATSENIALVVDADVGTPHTLTGFVVMNATVSGGRLTHVWDVLDANGQRIERLSGEEEVNVPKGTKDVWAAISPAISQVIADQVVSKLRAVVSAAPAAGPLAR